MRHLTVVLALASLLVIPISLAHGAVLRAPAPDSSFAQEYHEAYPLDGDGANDVRAIAVDLEGNVWAGAKAGLFVLNKGEKTWQPVMDEEDAGPVFDIAVDSQGIVWVGAWNGLHRTMDGGLMRVEEVEGPVASVCSTDTGIACVGLERLWFLGKGRQGSASSRTMSRCFRAMIDDGEKGLWIATSDGLYHRQQNGASKRFLYAKDVLTADTHGLAYAPDGKLWVAGLGGVTLYEGTKPVQFLTSEDGLPSVYVHSVAQAPDGVMWVGTALGVVRFDGGSTSLRHSRRWLLDDNVRDVAFDASGTAWIATAKGVSAIKRRTMTFAEKAQYFQGISDTRHMREPGLVESCLLDKPGDVTNWQPADDDNDGQYTAMYLVGESYRYAVTKSAEAKRKAKKAFDALRYLQTVTESDGFVARTVIPTTWDRMYDPNRTLTEQEWAAKQIENPREKRLVNHWRKSSNGKWWWKGDTSSDEMTGHMYGYMYYYDLVADEAERKEVAAHVCKIVDYIIDNGYVLKDLDGTHTQWGVWSPELLNHDGDWTGERGINAVEIVSYLKLAYHVSGDERYQNEYLSLLHDHGYLEFVRNAKNFNLMWRTHIDDELLALAFPALLVYETDPKLLRVYRQSLDRWYSGIEGDQSAYFNFIYASLGRAKNPRLDESIAFLRDAPLDLIDWKLDNSKREDLDLVRAPEIEPLQTSRMLPPSERGVIRWDKNPWAAVQGASGISEWAPTYWLLPYWMGRYYGYIQASQ